MEQPSTLWVVEVERCDALSEMEVLHFAHIRLAVGVAVVVVAAAAAAVVAAAAVPAVAVVLAVAPAVAVVVAAAAVVADVQQPAIKNLNIYISHL